MERLIKIVLEYKNKLIEESVLDTSDSQIYYVKIKDINEAIKEATQELEEIERKYNYFGFKQ